MLKPIKYLLTVLICWLGLPWVDPALLAQQKFYPFDLPDLQFIRYDTNTFELVQNNPAYQELFARFDDMIRNGNKQIKIVHLGGSHIQADIYTHRIRQELQSFYPGIMGSRGFFFPHTLAHTNSPSNLRVTYTGEWETCKNTQSRPVYPIGLSGFTAALKNTKGSLTIVARYDTIQQYDFNRVRIFCNTQANGIIPALNPGLPVTTVEVNTQGGYIQYNLGIYADTLRIFITQPDSLPQPFQLYGISLENDDPGVVYNSIGVNGAMLTSYLRCGLFGQQLKALDPDWIIISIGTNEGNTRQFDEISYRTEYQKMLDSIRLVMPNAAILLTVPNDCYLLKRYANPNTARIRQIIFSLAQTNGCGVWDFYTIMGGFNSSMEWYNKGLMSKDHIHFNKTGYLLKGDLFFTAFLKSWEMHLAEPPAQVTHIMQPIIHPVIIQQPAND
jgi:lysophospholipase L1-like esterase